MKRARSARWFAGFPPSQFARGCPEEWPTADWYLRKVASDPSIAHTALVSDNEQVQLKPGEWLDNDGDPDIVDDEYKQMLAELGVPKAFTLAEHDRATAYAARLIKAVMSKPWDGIVR